MARMIDLAKERDPPQTPLGALRIVQAEMADAQNCVRRLSQLLRLA
jgi:hypothetical protein